MRGASRRGSDASDVSLQDFAWPRATLATLRHSTLPWTDAGAVTPLGDLRNLGTRDRLSLTGQFAAHVAVLQAAGVAAGEFDASDWVVARKRGADCRLVRVTVRAPDSTPSSFEGILQFAATIDAPALDVLALSWTRAESVYAEVRRRLRNDAAADLKWLRQSAFGEILWPGPEALGSMWESGGPHVVDDVTAFRAYAQLDSSVQLVEIGTEFPIQRYAALASADASLPGSALSPAAVADRLVERLASPRHVVIVHGRLDDDSRRVVDILRSARDPGVTPRRCRRIVLSTRIAAQRALDDRLNAVSAPQQWVADFVSSPAYDAFLEHGTMPADDGPLAATPEPRRSYVGVLALLGTRVPRNLARDFLAQFLFEQPLEDLVIEGVTSLDPEAFLFASEAARDLCARHIPEDSRGALCRAAATVADPIRAGLLLVECGDVKGGVERLEAVRWRSAAESVRTLETIPRASLSPRLARTLASALIDSGRYGDARDLASGLEGDDGELLLARCDRRTGQYAAAMSRLDRIASPSFDAQILRMELLRLSGREDEARTVGAVPGEGEEAIRLAYEQALLDLETSAPLDGGHYFGQRLETYRALLGDDFERAGELAGHSVAAARCARERIDAELDRVFASFSSGRWDETRAIALEALSTVDEAQGDRAAAGILFTLTFVEIDDARWSSAAQHIRRLRDYYTRMGDELRFAEIDLLSGYYEFSCARFAEARRIAETLLGRRDLLTQVREAAALIVDEIDWIEHRHSPLRSTGRSKNRELDERHRFLKSRGELPFDAHTASTRSQKLKLMRAALAGDDADLAQRLAGELSVVLPTANASRTTADVDMLRMAASAEYPFRDGIFPLPWCHATRNRLGHWSQDGSCTFDDATLDRLVASPESNWLSIPDRELLFIDGCESWPEPSRAAIAAIFHTRAENHRLRRVVELEQSPPAARAERADGIVGESAAMRAVFTLIEKLAPRDVPVCVLGESGTGKELVGRAIHRTSQRRSKPFTAINCAALPENLVESELFGHTRGAFTGADRDRAGVIETTDGGTLFLDEIGEMPLAAQAKLLRFLQDGEFRRVGDSTNRTADVRVVSATNRQLEAAVEEGRFREDLYYRIRGVDVVLPPLRDRATDIMLLAEHFLERERVRHRAGPQSFTSEVEALLRAYAWPGNVRELQNTVRAAHAMAGEARAIDIEHLPERMRNVRPARAEAGSYQDAVARFRRDLIEKSLAEVAGNQNRAAALLKISRQALAYQIRELGIMVGKPRPGPRV